MAKAPQRWLPVAAPEGAPLEPGSVAAWVEEDVLVAIWVCLRLLHGRQHPAIHQRFGPAMQVVAMPRCIPPEELVLSAVPLTDHRCAPSLRRAHLKRERC
jgi:hypothetical protein